MANFPTSLPGLKNDFDNTDNIASADQNDSANEVNAIGAKVGIDSSAVTTSHDYKLSGITGSDKAASKAGTETLTNKTLTSPVLTTPQINDTSSDHQYVFAVSELASDRTVTLPLLTGNDEFVFKAHAQTLTNKTLGATTLSGVMTASAAINITIANEGNDIPLTVTQNDTTNNPNAVTVTNTGTGRGLFIDQDGNGEALKIENAGTNFGIYLAQTGTLANGDYGMLLYSNTAQVTNARFVQVTLANASSTCDCVGIQNDGTGNGLFIDQNGAANAIHVDYDGGAGSAAIRLDGCTGSSSKNPESQSQDGWLKINVDGTDRYVPYYAAS